MPHVFNIPTKNSFSERPAIVQVVRDPITHKPRRLSIKDGYETTSVKLDEATIRQIVNALTSAE